MLEAIEKGTFKALQTATRRSRSWSTPRAPTSRWCARSSPRSSRALLPPVSLDRRALDGWAAFDKQFGILNEEPDVEQTFRLR